MPLLGQLLDHGLDGLWRNERFAEIEVIFSSLPVNGNGLVGAARPMRTRSATLRNRLAICWEEGPAGVLNILGRQRVLRPEMETRRPRESASSGAWLLRKKNGDATLRTTSFAVALGAALALPVSTVAVNAMGGSCHLRRACAVDLDSLCTGATPGAGHLRACLAAHSSGLSTFCSAKLSREIYVATECEADAMRFCGNVASRGDRIASCVQQHLSEVSGSCKDALASIDAPGHDQ